MSAKKYKYNIDKEAILKDYGSLSKFGEMNGVSPISVSKHTREGIVENSVFVPTYFPYLGEKVEYEGPLHNNVWGTAFKKVIFEKVVFEPYDTDINKILKLHEQDLKGHELYLQLLNDGHITDQFFLSLKESDMVPKIVEETQKQLEEYEGHT